MSDAPSEVVLHLLERSRERPRAIALADDRRSLTYDEVAQTANGLAERLPREDRPVIVLVDRRVESIVALFGVLWSGRAVVAVGADDPPARIRELVRRCAASTIVDATSTLDGGLDDCVVIAMADVRPEAGAPRTTSRDALAHLLFTSGSSGPPKGVPRTTSQLDLQFARWVDWTDFREPDDAGGHDRGRVAGPTTRVAPLDGSTGVLVPPVFQGGFTASVFAVAAGRRVELIDPVDDDLSSIAARIDDRSIERLTLTPSHIRALSRGLARRRRLETVHEVFGVGEPSEGAHVDAVRTFAAEHVVYRARYGASEIIGVFNSGVAIRAHDMVGPGPLPMGAMPPPSRARLESIDGRTDVGELIVRAPVVDGYWNDPVLTARDFGVDPDGVRFWRTGDLVVIDDHGVLHPRGRIGDMAKINGRLVEPAESEFALRSVPGVRGAVSLPRRLTSGRYQLVGHVEADPMVSAADMRRTLLSTLPVGVVPGVLVRHDRLPLTPRGKIDREALRTRPVTPWTDTDLRGPTSMLERTIVATIAKVLDLESVGVDDDLFAIGCDSLAAIELVETLGTLCDVGLTPNDLVECPSAALLARRIDTTRRSSPDWVVIRNRDGARPPIHLICGGGAPALQYQPLVDHLGPDQPVAIYEQFGLHGQGGRDRSIARAVDRHLARVIDLSPTGPIVLLGHSYGGRVANDMAIALASSGRTVELVVLDAHDWRPTDDGPRRPGAVGRLIGRARRTRLGLRTLDERLDRFRSMDDEARYARHFVYAGRDSANHRLEAFDGPTLYIRADDPVAQVRWPLTKNTRVVDAPGDHNTMLQYRETAAFIEEIIDRSLTA